VGWLIRNATQPGFPQGKFVTKRKKNQKRKRPVENDALWKSANKSVAFGSIFLMRIPTAAWKSLAKPLGFPTFTTGPAAIHSMNHNLHIKNYKWWLRPERKVAKLPWPGADGHERSECEPDRAKQGRVVPEPNRDNWWISSSEPPRRGG